MADTQPMWLSGNTGGSEAHVRQGWNRNWQKGNNGKSLWANASAAVLNTPSTPHPNSVTGKVQQRYAGMNQSAGYIGKHSKQSGKHHAPIDTANILNSTQLQNTSTYVGKHTPSGQAFAAHNAKIAAHQAAIAPAVAASQQHVANQVSAAKAKATAKADRRKKIGGAVTQGLAVGIALSAKHKGNNEELLKKFVK